MARTVLVDTGFLVALQNRRDTNHQWALSQAAERPIPWNTCEAVFGEAFHLLGEPGAQAMCELATRRVVISAFSLEDNLEPVIALLNKYASVPMSFADACLVRMSELLPDPILLTTDSDFRIYRRHSRQVIPCEMPPGSR